MEVSASWTNKDRLILGSLVLLTESPEVKEVILKNLKQHKKDPFTCL